MAYDNEKLNYGKEHIYIVDVMMKRCFQKSGVAPCNATETGDDKCFNTLATCNFLSAYSPAGTIGQYRFYQSRSQVPGGLPGTLFSGMDPIPSLLTVSTSPAIIDLAGGLGTRASVTCTFKDHPHSDIGIDNYIDDRTYIASERGSFWTKFRSRFPDYQNKEIRIMSGFLVDGEYNPFNFTTRYYIIDKMTVTNGMCTITAKDPLKLASNKKAQAPAVSTGQLSAGITSGALSATLSPAGIGNLEYPASGKVLINSEVISFTRAADVLTLTRAQNNTPSSAHNADDTVQLCLEYVGKQVDFIVNDLLTNYANIDASFVPDAAWSAEVDTFLNGLLTGIVVKPFDVYKLLKELAESMPHYLWWDEREQVIQLTALKSPPSGTSVIDMDSNIVADKFRTSDRPELRKSTVFINFGQFDPTKRLDEFSNYQQTYARIDSDSITKYGSNEIKTINSRWISNFNKAAALQLGALIGRRFSDIPREVSFSLEAKDSSFWVGQSVTVSHRDITDFTGAPKDTVIQLLSSKESKNFDYTGLEFTYGESLPDDEGGGDPDVDLVIIGGDIYNANLRDIYNNLFPAPDATTQVKIIIDTSVKVGSLSTGVYAVDTGSWPAGAIVTLEVNIGSFLVGRGGDGGTGASAQGGAGGGALILNHDLTLVNNGTILGGGGGGGGQFNLGDSTVVGGGGGAGYDAGLGGIGTINGVNGVLSSGGAGGNSSAGDGGSLGQNGFDSSVAPIALGGVAGIAINQNGFTLT